MYDGITNLIENIVEIFMDNFSVLGIHLTIFLIMKGGVAKV